MGKLAVKKLAYFISILFTFLILLFSIVSSLSGKVDPNNNITAAYFALAAPFFVVLNTLLLLYWIVRWRYWCFVPLIGLFALYSYIISMFQVFSSTKYSSDSKLSLVTYNVHSFGNEVTGYSAKEFAKLLNNNDVDVVCFQEYISNGDFTDKDLYDTFSQRFKYSYIPEKSGMAIYSKYPILDRQEINFENSNNGALWADIEVKGAKVRVISVHMQTTSYNRMKSKVAKAKDEKNEELEQNLIVQYYTNSLDENIKARANQAKIIAELVNSTTSPILLCGDFNDIPQTYTYRTLKGFLSDGFIAAGKGFGATYKGIYDLMRIDYIFYSDAFSPIRYQTIPFDMSDHNPVFMEVGL